VLKARGSRPRRRRALGHGERVFPSAPGERCGEGLFELGALTWNISVHSGELL